MNVCGEKGRKGRKRKEREKAGLGKEGKDCRPRGHRRGSSVARHTNKRKGKV